MDGIVIFKTELKKNNIFKIIGESKAGKNLVHQLKKVKQFLYIQVHPFQGLIKQLSQKKTILILKKIG